MIMALGLGQLFYAILLFINAIAVLSEERFLARSRSLSVCEWTHIHAFSL